MHGNQLFSAVESLSILLYGIMADYLDFTSKNQLIAGSQPLRSRCCHRPIVGLVQFDERCLLIDQSQPHIKLWGYECCECDDMRRRGDTWLNQRSNFSPSAVSWRFQAVLTANVVTVSGEFCAVGGIWMSSSSSEPEDELASLSNEGSQSISSANSVSVVFGAAGAH